MLPNLFHVKTHVEYHVCMAPMGKLMRLLETGGNQPELTLSEGHQATGGLIGPQPTYTRQAALSIRKLWFMVSQNQKYEENLLVNIVQL